MEHQVRPEHTKENPLLHVFTQPLHHELDVIQRPFSKQSGLNSKFFLLVDKTILPRLKNAVCPTIYSELEGEVSHAFLKAISVK